MDRNERLPLNEIYRQSEPWWDLKEQAGLLEGIPPAQQRSLKVLDDHALNSILGNVQIPTLKEAYRIITRDPDFLFYSPGSNKDIERERSRAIADFKANIEIIFEDRIDLNLVCPRNPATWLRLNAEIFACYEVFLLEGVIRITSDQKEKIEQFRLLKQQPSIRYLQQLSQIRFDL